MKLLTKSIKFKYPMILFVITAISLFLRLYYLGEPHGAGYDELASIGVANQSFPFGIISKLYNQDYHMPFYFFVLHFWLKIFGSADISARILSVIIGTLTVPVMFLAGKELKSDKIGLIAATITGASSLLIYYSQEIRFYSLLGLLSALILLFIIRVNKKPIRSNYLGLYIANILMMYTFTTGIAFVFFELVIFNMYLYIYEKKELKKMLILSFLTFLAFVPYLPMLFHQSAMASKSLINPSFWGGQSNVYSKIAIINDLITPFLVNIHVHSPKSLHDLYIACFNIYNTSRNDGLVIFPGLYRYILAISELNIFIYVIGIIISFQKKGFSIIIFIIGVLFFIFTIFCSTHHIIAMTSRYFIPFLPFLILTVSHGLGEEFNKIKFLFILVITLNISVLLYYPYSAARIERLDKFGIVYKNLKEYEINKNDVVVIPFGARFFDQYYQNATVFPFDYELAFLYGNKKYLNLALGNNISNMLNEENKSEILRNYLINNTQNIEFKKYFEEEAINKLQKGHYLVLAFTNLNSPFSTKDLKNKAGNIIKYNEKQNLELYVWLCSKITNDILNHSYHDKRLKPKVLIIEGKTREIIYGQNIQKIDFPASVNSSPITWEIHIFEKIN